MKITRKELRRLITEVIEDKDRGEVIRLYQGAVDWFTDTLFPAISEDFVNGSVDVIALATQGGVSGIPVAQGDPSTHDYTINNRVIYMIPKGLSIDSANGLITLVDVYGEGGDRHEGIDNIYNNMAGEITAHGLDSHVIVPEIPNDVLNAIQTSDT